MTEPQIVWIVTWSTGQVFGVCNSLERARRAVGDLRDSDLEGDADGMEIEPWEVIGDNE